jgi:hypothetical protein
MGCIVIFGTRPDLISKFCEKHKIKEQKKDDKMKEQNKNILTKYCWCSGAIVPESGGALCSVEGQWSSALHLRLGT